MKKTKQSISEGGLLKLGLDLGRCQALAMVEGCTQIRMYEEADFKMKRVSPSPYSTSQYPWKFQGMSKVISNVKCQGLDYINLALWEEVPNLRGPV